MSDFFPIFKRRLLAMSVRNPGTQRWVSKHYFFIVQNYDREMAGGNTQNNSVSINIDKICMQSQCKNILSYFIISRIYSVITRPVQ